MRLHHRIVIPFAIVALLATAVASAVTLSVASRALRSRLEAQLVGAVAVVSRGDMALNRVILQNVRDITGADVITLDAGGGVAATTVDAARGELTAAVRQAIGATGEQGGDRPTAVWTDCGAPCLVVYSRIQGRPGSIVAFVAETSDVAAATQTVARVILLAAVLGVVTMVLVSGAVVRRVTAPLQRLVRFARNLSPDDPRRADVGDDEVGELAEAFNGMLDRLQRSRDALVRSEKLALAGLFAARVAHDIRNPLSSIKMQTQLLRGRLDPEGEATVVSVLHDIEQVESVVRDLLEVARPGDLRLQLAPVNEVIDDALRQVAAQFAHRKIAVDARLDPGAPAVMLDRSRFKQALLNVLVNASEAMPSGGSVTVVSRHEAGTGVRVEICDTGTGVDPAVLDRVFDPFVSTKADGVGLGLVNVKAVVEGHGGQIRLEPRQPSGTCASITLPLPAAAAAASSGRGSGAR